MWIQVAVFFFFFKPHMQRICRRFCLNKSSSQGRLNATLSFYSPFTTSIISYFKKKKKNCAGFLVTVRGAAKPLIFEPCFISPSSRAVRLFVRHRAGTYRNTLDVEVLKARESHLKEMMCWPLCQARQKNANPFISAGLQEPHTHTCASSLATV